MERRTGVRASVSLAALAAVVLGGLPAMGPAGYASQVGGGSVTGRVVWCTPGPIIMGVATAEGVVVPSVVLPPGTEQPAGAPSPPFDVVVRVQPGDGPEPSVPEVYPDPIFPPGPRPRPERLIPAGAVLVALQGTSMSTRTDEDGRFRLNNVPVGQYLTLGIGPLRSAPSATALRPNVFLDQAGQAIDLGQITLGQQPCPFMQPRPLAPDQPGAEPGSPPTAPRRPE